MDEVIKILTAKNKTIATMESCTGGALANSITDIPGASEVFRFGAITYAHEFKIKMGVDSQIIAKYSVYSPEVARDMSKTIATFADANYGVGITGKLNRVDRFNPTGDDSQVFISIYDQNQEKFYEFSLQVPYSSRKQNKDFIIREITKKLLTII